MFDLKNKTALVSGGSRGIGKHIALALLAEGANVLVGSRSEEELHAFVREAGSPALAGRALDVRDRASVREFVQFGLSRWGQIDILVNCAGVNYRVPAEDYPEEQWLNVIDINLNGAYRMCQEVGRHMIERRSGSIVNITSMMSHVTTPNQSAYAASKAALAQYTKLLAVEWGKYNIRVNGVSPGYIVTEMSKDVLLQPDFQQRIVDKTPQNRLGSPGEIADAVVFLASGRATFINGHVLAVDGGFLAGHPSIYVNPKPEA
ncbi:SDR family NAD(P)-dependent oxidoreductase [Paenibacillus humicola]|uniref:SDR family NAD(P)-dependent oxidoreductase n=1 Tax=Paenibacillus humicola TaxID=3110540 RepID=UPI00237BECB4|nr:3-oxoacyl-ACP reductase FabG [Paenibacillus humicola]